MLKIVKKFSDLDMPALMNIYLQSCIEKGRQDYRQLSEEQQLLRANDDLIDYMRHDFFSVQGAFCALWERQGLPVSALRIEPYRDGVILTALETASQARGNGYAKALVSQVLIYLHSEGIQKVYSHIDKRNKPSLAVHAYCGFRKLLDHAVYLDRSVSHRAYTFLYEN